MFSVMIIKNRSSLSEIVIKGEMYLPSLVGEGAGAAEGWA